MSKILIGNIKGPKGDKGEQGAVGPKGEQGIQGPEGPAGGVNSVNGMTGDVTVEDTQGVNLLTGTRDFSGEWVSLKEWKKENETYKGMSVYSKNSRYGGIYQKIPIKAGEKYTFSCFVKTSVNTQIGIGYDNNAEGIAFCTPIVNPVNSDTEWKRVSQVFDVKSDGDGTFKVELRSEFSQEGATLYVCGYKLEPGTVPNPVWTPAPEDVVVRSELPTSLNVIFPKNAGAHNSVFRGNNLGTEVTAEQYAAISSGSFDNLFVGDYWTIDKVIYRIAGLDLFLHYGDTELKTHHAVVVPDAPLYNGKMNDSDTADGAYNTSLMKTSGLNDALERVKEDFGETHIIKHRALLPNAISGSSPSGWAWCDSYIDLMTERQVYGSPAWGQAEHNGYDVNTQYSRFPLFTLAPEYICACRQWWWLQDVRSASAFGYVGDAGSASCHGASASGGVRPAFLIG